MMRTRTGNLGARMAAVALSLALLVVVAQPFGTAGQSSPSGSPLQGDWTVTIVKDDVPTSVANGPSAIGQWRLSFKPGGTYELARLDLGTLVTGTYSVKGNQVTIKDASGLLSCSNPQPGTGLDVATATYVWSVKSNKLTLTANQDGCAIRKVILATRALSVYVACITTPLAALAGTSAAAPAGTPVASPQASLFGKPATTSPSTAADQIDTLLAQITSCWSTGEPARLLPLFSTDLLSGIVSQAGSIQAVASTIQPLMSLPFTWERAGDVQRTGANSASAVVRISLQNHEDFQRFDFVLQNGVWKVDTFIIGPQDLPGAQPTPGASGTAGA